MFDPTIFDNLKVVLEGKIYDLDQEGEWLVIGREDLIDLAGFGRTFRMRVQRPGEACIAALTLASGLADFAAELRGLRLVGEEPGARLEVSFELAGDHTARADEIDERLAAIWGDAVIMRQERTVPVQPRTGTAFAAADEGKHRIVLTFNHPIDERHLGELDGLVMQALDSLQFLSE
ncbi:hypothetical protein L3476_09095 [Paenibacillus thiaminolyticus]|uniref:hypothetical protein n=1 Tax=Paenibacillus thiaminolyticus TaxID=49283 RepID=UPI0011645571|nr:hypothetical protein [Paenibacillus thiaminolyticus]NGP58971.1 hypothetical protein [Paenibacillus thiaminolyticus]WCR28856.1 hypothetical protein L3476_09095 [Paenibacillus thiaminolyticus]